MPIYEYHCDNCSNDFEKLTGVSESSKEAECPKCKSSARRKISLTSYQLTGSGFHNTDYKKTGERCSAAGDKPACASCQAAKQ